MRKSVIDVKFLVMLPCLIKHHYSISGCKPDVLVIYLNILISSRPVSPDL